jgi:hypothetical protein
MLEYKLFLDKISSILKSGTYDIFKSDNFKYTKVKINCKLFVVCIMFHVNKIIAVYDFFQTKNIRI